MPTDHPTPHSAPGTGPATARPVPGGYRLRPATAEDAAALGAVHVACWRQTYPDLPAPWWQAFTPEQKASDWRTTLQRPDPARTVVLAERDGRVIGFAAAGPTIPRPGVIDGAARELYMLYVLAADHGSGAGQALLEAMGTGPLQAWVAEDIPRAHAFYARNGFRPDGAVDQLVEICGGMPHVRLVRRPARR